MRDSQASTPTANHVATIQDWAALSAAVVQVAKQICSVVNVVVTKPRSAASTCWSVGDPHFSTFAMSPKQWYDFYGIGIYTLLKTSRVEIQPKHIKAGRASANAGVACKDRASGESVTLTVANGQIAVAWSSGSDGKCNGACTLTRPNPTTATWTHSSGITVTARAFGGWIPMNIYVDAKSGALDGEFPASGLCISSSHTTAVGTGDKFYIGTTPTVGTYTPDDNCTPEMLAKANFACTGVCAGSAQICIRDVCASGKVEAALVIKTACSDAVTIGNGQPLTGDAVTAATKVATPGGTCASVGDPHFTTFAGDRFDFYGRGLYSLLDTSEVAIQPLHFACGRASCNKGIAVYDKKTGEGATISATGGGGTSMVYFKTSGKTGGVVAKPNSYSTTWTHSSGITVTIRAFRGGYMNIYVNAKTGAVDGDTLASGLCISRSHTQSIPGGGSYYVFTGGDTHSNTLVSYTPDTTCTTTLKLSAQAACKDTGTMMQNCIADVCATGNVGSADIIKAAMSDIKDIKNGNGLTMGQVTKAPMVKSSPGTCASMGDPHFTTFTGGRFDFYGVGVFSLLDTSNVTVQPLHKRCGRASCNTGVAVYDKTTGEGVTLQGGAKTYFKTSGNAGGVLATPRAQTTTWTHSSGVVVTYRSFGEWANIYVKITTGALDGDTAASGLCIDKNDNNNVGATNNIYKFSSGDSYTSTLGTYTPDTSCTEEMQEKAALACKGAGDMVKECIADVCATGDVGSAEIIKCGVSDIKNIKSGTSLTYTVTEPPAAASAAGSCYSVGDPHFRTFAGVTYDNYGTGVFLLLSTSKLELQPLHKKWGRASVNVGLALLDRASGFALTLRAMPNGGIAQAANQGKNCDRKVCSYVQHGGVGVENFIWTHSSGITVTFRAFKGGYANIYVTAKAGALDGGVAASGLCISKSNNQNVKEADVVYTFATGETYANSISTYTPDVSCTEAMQKKANLACKDAGTLVTECIMDVCATGEVSSAVLILTAADDIKRLASGLTLVGNAVTPGPVESLAGMCHSTGDPHFTTFTNQRFDFYGTGLFSLLRTSKLAIQPLHKRCGRASCNVGVAFQDRASGFAVTISATAAGNIKVEASTGAQCPTGVCQLVNRGSTATFLHSSGITATVRAFQGMVNIYVNAMPGALDGEAAASGLCIGSTHNSNVPGGDSFYIFSGGDSYTNTRTAYVPDATCTILQKQVALQACKSLVGTTWLQECVKDVCATGDASSALMIMTAQADIRSIGSGTPVSLGAVTAKPTVAPWVESKEEFTCVGDAWTIHEGCDCDYTLGVKEIKTHYLGFNWKGWKDDRSKCHSSCKGDPTCVAYFFDERGLRSEMCKRFMRSDTSGYKTRHCGRARDRCAIRKGCKPKTKKDLTKATIYCGGGGGGA